MDEVLKAFIELVAGNSGGWFSRLFVIVVITGGSLFILSKLIDSLTASGLLKQRLTVDDVADLVKMIDEVKRRLDDLDKSVKDAAADAGKEADEINDRLEELGKELEDVSEVVDEIKDTAVNNLIPIERDVTNLASESRMHYTELNRQIQALQKDLSAIQGTILGLGTNRARLK